MALQVFNKVAKVTTSSQVTITCAETVPAYSLITAHGFRANSNNNTHAGKIAGFTTTIGLISSEVVVITEGLITNSNWNWPVGSQLFLNGQVVSLIPPTSGWNQCIGTSKNNNTILINFGESILL